MDTHLKSFAVAGILVKEDKVLLVRHTYGNAKNMLLIPGGYVNENEMPEQAVIREFKEETSLSVKPKELVAIKFTTDNWYVVFNMEYINGDKISDGYENSEVVYLNIKEAINREDVTNTTKSLLKVFMNNKLEKIDYRPDRYKEDEFSLYT
jgi:ADP-ribose pyrophosphatase YjhB (NUDIX family)